ncbi:MULTISPECIES: ferritin-like domain-containing protein [Aphanothece]|uniref:ferritin-like domain-containing protein n=1 Tax=Aphanothece TaxID=1121 RepID=UPI00398EE065
MHPRVLGYLGRALSLELSAVQQYMTQASLLELWGDTESAGRFREETVEEMRHAEQLVQRMLTLGVAPAASQLKPVAHARDLAGLLRHDAVLEAELINHYAEAVRFCLLIGDSENESFFRTLWTEEQHHGEELEAWLRSLQSQAYRVLERATF